MDYRIKEYSIMGYGQRLDKRGKPLQEDCIYPAPGHDKPSDRLFIVCDGMGGENAGDLASNTVCRAMSRAIVKKGEYDLFNLDDLRRAIESAYNALDRIDNAGREKMGTTMAMLKLYDDGYYTAHIGDSRVYHIRPGKTPLDTEIVFCTRDHSLVNHLVDKGEMTPCEALTSPKRHVITRAMQPKMNRRSSADVHAAEDIRPGDFFLLCTDGLLENMTDDNIRAIFSLEGGNDRNKAALLAKVAANSVDNYSAIIVHINDVFERMTIDPITKPIHIPKTDDMQSLAQAKATVAEKTREFVRKRKEKGDAGALFLKFLIALMILLSLIMMIYYMFVHKDETLQTAGTAVDSAIETHGGNEPEVETYGYEITEQDKKNAVEPVSNIMSEEDEAVDEDIYEEIVQEPETEPQAQQPTPQNDNKALQPKPLPKPAKSTDPVEPILQE